MVLRGVPMPQNAIGYNNKAFTASDSTAILWAVNLSFEDGHGKYSD